MKQLKADELKEELAQLPGSPKYTKAPEAKVALMRHIEATYSSTPTCLEDGTEVRIDWRVRKTWLCKDLKAIMFPEAQEQLAITQAAPKKRRVLGAGALRCSPAPLLLQPPAAPLPVVQSYVVEYVDGLALEVAQPPTA